MIAGNLQGSRRTSPRSSPGTATSRSPSATKPSTPTKPSTWASSPAAAPSGPVRNTAPPPTPNGKNSPATSNAAKSPPAPGRAFGTPCIHEHICLRCSMHWPDPAERDRITEIRDNLTARITEAQHEGWLGENRRPQSQPRRSRRQTRPDRPARPPGTHRPRHTHHQPQTLNSNTPALVTRTQFVQVQRMPLTARLRTGASSAIMAPCLACRSKMCPSRLMLSCGNAQLPRTSPSRST